MAIIKTIKNKEPKIGKDCFLAENATLVGDITMGSNCSIWFNAVLRGDVNSIVLGEKVNIQDGAVVHCTYQKTKTMIGNNVSVGHNAIIHGCIIHDDVLIGMGAIVMDEAVVESGSIVAAGAIVTQGTRIGKGELWAGVPAKKIKEVSNDLQENEIRRIADNYIKYAKWFKNPKP
ncbi:MAG: gamma carbonic anhydrase family protein [Flavobacteriales bacterium]